MAASNQTKDPTLLVTQKVYRGKTTISLKDFDYRPTGIVTNADGSNAVYYQDTKGIGLRSQACPTGVFTTQETYTLSQLFADESKYKNDRTMMVALVMLLRLLLAITVALVYIKRDQDLFN